MAISGKKTVVAVKIFQKKKGLTNDGIVGLKTWSALSGNAKTPVSRQNTTALTINAPWHDIAQVEMGVKEILGANTNNQRILDYHATTTLGAKIESVIRIQVVRQAIMWDFILRQTRW
ncbi:peptidoglycan-binding domain-containing protein [Teredinibacter haidensis]|uniref:peptidoglycan-binding domain-containing protein n=1 Tax=Teredinibacter haidensis TaxID=2731755 RepID=UPI001FED02EF|nr:peptidoglycan-binding domain-containing protein [Teredinibacter haidensis]